MRHCRINLVQFCDIILTTHRPQRLSAGASSTVRSSTVVHRSETAASPGLVQQNARLQPCHPSALVTACHVRAECYSPARMSKH